MEFLGVSHGVSRRNSMIARDGGAGAEPGRPGRRPTSVDGLGVRKGLALVGVVGVGLLVGCTDRDAGTNAGAGESVASELADAHARWEQAGVADYSYVLHSDCGERTLLGRFRITVRDGTVSAADGLDERGEHFVRGIGPEYVPTIDELWDELLHAAEDGADTARGEFDEALGYPTSITIDYERRASDDEACYEITEFVGE
jgi:Family of unknown function (DUF6174)